jgi:hypothetical protein
VANLDQLHHAVRAAYREEMKKHQGPEAAFDELMPLVSRHWPGMSPDELRKQLAWMIAKEPSN